jgi:hypothetical protein
MVRIVVVLALATSLAHAESLDVKATLAKLDGCVLDELGAIEKADTIGKRPVAEIVQLTGKKARGYVIRAHETCYVVAVVGKPVDFAKGNFGGAATTAFALRSSKSDGDPGVSVVSLKSKDDALLDVLVLPEDCEDAMTLAKRSVFAGRDSLVLGCYTSGGADQGRGDMLLDAGDGSLRVLLNVNAGIAWVQGPKAGGKPYEMCTARSPGGLRIVTAGAKPVVEAVEPAQAEEAEAAKVEWTSGGCEAIVKTTRYEHDGKKLVVKGKPRLSRVKKLCNCKTAS